MKAIEEILVPCGEGIEIRKTPTEYRRKTVNLPTWTLFCRLPANNLDDFYRDMTLKHYLTTWDKKLRKSAAKI